MTDARTRRVFVEMLREEWRLHSRLFSGRRFTLFPVFVALLVAGGTELLVITGTTLDTVFAGLHGLAFLFGLHTGSIGFVGRDALRNLLGDLTLLVFSARTLPLSQRRLLGVFVAKDVVYYAFLFLLPMALGVLPAVVGTRGLSATGSVAGTVFLLWATLTGSFVLGVGATIAGVGLSSRGVPSLVVLVALAAALGTGWVVGLDVVSYTPYGVFLVPTIPHVVASAVVIAVVFLIGAVTFGVNASRTARTAGPTFRRWQDWIGDPVATRTLLDVHRSAGGFGTVLFSGVILFGVTAALVDLAGQITGVSPSVGISFGAILGLSGFTIYNWLTQSDDLDSYLVYPLDVPDVFRAKVRAFHLVGPPVGVAFYAVALARRGGRPLEALVGAVLLVGVAYYIFGVTVYLTGFAPNEFLFDTVLFAAFGAAMIVPLVPILVVGFAFAPVSAALLGVLGVGGLALGGVGVVLYRRARPKWHRHHRV